MKIILKPKEYEFLRKAVASYHPYWMESPDDLSDEEILERKEDKKMIKIFKQKFHL